MSFIQTSFLNQYELIRLKTLIKKCDGYEPYYEIESDAASNSCIYHILSYDEISGELTGFLSGLFTEENNSTQYNCEITAMVIPECRRKGLFTQMFQAFQSHFEYSNAEIQISILNESTPDMTNALPCSKMINMTNMANMANWANSAETANNTIGTSIQYSCALPDFLTSSHLNKGLLHSEYLMELSNISDTIVTLLETASDPYEYYFTDEMDAYLMYLPETDELINKGLKADEYNSDEPIAVCSLDLQPSFTNIYEVFVEENLRGHGIGFLFMSHLVFDYFEEQAPDKVIPLILQVSSTNASALHLYKKCGFYEKSHISYYLI